MTRRRHTRQTLAPRHDRFGTRPLALAPRSFSQGAFPPPSVDPSFYRRLASHRAKLVIEVDGGEHNDEVDVARTAVIEQKGYCVIRFWNHDVLGNTDGVWTVIDAALHGRHPHPTLPHQGGGL
ncbi:MAG: DUF559 domain-containing protein [Sphingomonas sp.]|nr:DUF559 domain-containing protein [Sphingomonas sp.]